MKFDELYLSDDILDAIDAMHFQECTPIQERTIPLITDGKDLIAVAQTGTGKTAAYLLPVIDEIANGDYPQDAINCVIMAPTRELAQQIDQQMQGFAYYMPVSSLPIYGGTDGHTFEQQKNGLKLGADVVIATPGRLIAHISMGYVDLSKVSFLILDEADRMLDMGFYEDIMQIVKLMPKERQTLLFSATMPPKIKLLAKNILRNPAEVKLAVSKPAEKIAQSAYICYETQKIPILCNVFKTIESEKSIVFASSKLKCKELSKALRGLNLSVGEMHSDLDQTHREEVLLAFKSGRIKILVATDIMARGIDIDDIGLVVNYDVPHENEDYVHRIGRTARANNDGVAITFVSEREIGKFMRIEKFIGKEINKNPIPEEIGSGPEYIDKKEERSGKNSRRGRKKDRNKKKNQKSVVDGASQKEEVLSTQDAPSVPEMIETPEPEVIPAVDELSESIPIGESESVFEVTAVASDSESVKEELKAEDSSSEKEKADEPKKKKRKRRKKNKSEEAKVEVEEEEIDLGPDPYGGRPISYSMVSAMMAADARQRAERELAERDARRAAKGTSEPSSKTENKNTDVKDEPSTDSSQKIVVATEQLSAENPEAPKKKRGRKKKAPAATTEEPENATQSDSSENPETPKKKRGRKKKAPAATTEEPENTAQSDSSENPEAPKKKRGRKKKAPAATTEEPNNAAQSDSSENPEAPKKKRGRKKKANILQMESEGLKE